MQNNYSLKNNNNKKHKYILNIQVLVYFYGKDPPKKQIRNDIKKNKIG